MRQREEKNCLGPKTLYMVIMGALMYLANCTRPNIAFVVDLLAMFSVEPTKWH